MKTTKIIAAALLLFSGIGAHAQEMGNEPKGKAIVQIYTNFHSGFGVVNDDRGFELDRSYLGYEYNFGKGVSVKGVLDIGQSSSVNDYNHIAYIKNALVKWNIGNFTLQGGMIGMTQFSYQEKFWGYRYIYKSFQDQYKFGSSADLGLSASYKFADWLSGDVIIVNGEGYKKIQLHDGLQYGVGLTLNPAKELTLRLYGSLNEGGVDHAENIYNYALFAGYKHERFSIAGEFNSMQNYRNVKDHNLAGVSFYTTVKLGGRVNAFARYDNLWSKDDWNIEKDETTYMAGVEILPCQWVKISPNLRYHDARSADVKDHCMLYISCFFGF